VVLSAIDSNAEVVGSGLKGGGGGGGEERSNTPANRVGQPQLG